MKTELKHLIPEKKYAPVEVFPDLEIKYWQNVFKQKKNKKLPKFKVQPKIKTSVNETRTNPELIAIIKETFKESANVLSQLDFHVIMQKKYGANYNKQIGLIHMAKLGYKINTIRYIDGKERKCFNIELILKWEI